MKKIVQTLALLFLYAVCSNAEIRVDVPDVVGLNEQFNLSFTLSEKPSSFEWTPGDNFQLVWGPQTGSSTSISIVNGKTTRTSQYTYTYVLLPRRAGAFTLPAAKAKLGRGREEYSTAPHIEVVGESGQAAQGQDSGQASGKNGGGISESSSGQGDMYLKLLLGKTEVVVGEPLTATLKLFTRSSISGFEDARFPTFDGFWSQEVLSPKNIEFRRENVGGKIYNTAILRKWVLVPQKQGAANIDAAELVCLVQQRISSGNSIFDGFFDDFQTARKRLFSAAPTVTVKALPPGAPASFTGAVGKYSVKVSLSSDSLKVHDAASLTLTVTGKGNVALVGMPKVKFPPDSEVYDTKVSDRVDKGGTSGSKVFEYPFIPRSYGDFEIPPVEFTYFDTDAGKYVSVNTRAIRYNVARGEESNYVPVSGVSVPSVQGSEVRTLSEDIRFISTKLPHLVPGGGFFVWTPLFCGIAALMMIIAFLSCLIVYRTRRRRADVALVRTRAASKMARKRLAKAGGYLSRNLCSAFYEELHKTLLGYVTDKLNIGAADSGKEAVARALSSSGASDGAVSEYVALLDNCEFARYSPDTGNETMKDSYEKAVDVISRLESELGKLSSRRGKAVSAAVILILCAFNLKAENADYIDSLWNAGVSAYSEGDFTAAREAFTSIEKLSLASAGLYTNIADAYFKDRMLSSAILYYERALKLDPSFKDAQYNLELAHTMIQDRIEPVPEFFLKTLSRKLCYSLPSDLWAWLSLLFFALTLVMAGLFFLSRRRRFKITGFFCGIALLLVAVLCNVNATVQKADWENKDSAIVTVPVSSAKSAPSATSGADLFVLHEGTKVGIADRVGDWTKIVIADGREGWVKSDGLTVI